MTLEEFDSLTRKRISRIIHIQEKKLEQENEMKQKQLKEAERKAARDQSKMRQKSKYSRN